MSQGQQAEHWLMAGDPSEGDPEKDKKKRAAMAPPEEFKPAGNPGDDPLTRNLKKVYAEVAAEPIPDRLLRLLDKLDGKPPRDDNA